MPGKWRHATPCWIDTVLQRQSLPSEEMTNTGHVWKFKSFDLKMCLLVRILDWRRWGGKSIWIKKWEEENIQLKGRAEIRLRKEERESRHSYVLFIYIYVRILPQCYQLVGSGDGNSGIAVTWELVRNVDSRPHFCPPRLTKSDFLEWAPWICV